MMDVQRDNRVVSIVAKSGLRSMLNTMLDQLERCQKSLSEFLEVRRTPILPAAQLTLYMLNFSEETYSQFIWFLYYDMIQVV